MIKTRIKLLLVAGARPNFMKIAPIIRECAARSNRFEYRIVHTGQHYDAAMSDVFFDELGIPSPDYYLDVGSGNHSDQTAKIMSRFDPVCAKENPDCVIVVGDVNSTLACAIVAKKQNYPVAHIEAGLRSGDRRMPEEINRLVTDSISDFFFVTEQSGVDNLRLEGHDQSEVFFVGHVMIDNLFYELDRLTDSAPNTENGGEYGVVTLHRPSNVDSAATLGKIVSALNEVSSLIHLVFPVHPRTREKIKEFGLELRTKIRLVEPLGYRDFLQLWKGARIVLTDSGGLQEETTALGIPCLTLRENTERPVTVELGSNRLVGSEPAQITAAVQETLLNMGRKAVKPPFWDGKASVRILDALEANLAQK